MTSDGGNVSSRREADEQRGVPQEGGHAETGSKATESSRPDETPTPDLEGVVVTLDVEWQAEGELSDAERREQRARIEAAQDQLLDDLGSHGKVRRRLTTTAQLAVGVDEQGRRLLEQHELVAAVQDDTADQPAPAG